MRRRDLGLLWSRQWAEDPSRSAAIITEAVRQQCGVTVHPLSGTGVGAAAEVRRTPHGEWIVTMPIGEPPMYEGVPGNLAENRWPTRHDLDRVAPDHPVYIRAIWGHWRNTLPLVSIANTKALERAGIGRDTRPPAPSVEIERDAQGDPTGVLVEHTYKPLVEHTQMAVAPRFTLDDRVAGLAESMRIYNRCGTTSVFEGHGISSEVLGAYQALRERAGRACGRISCGVRPGRRPMLRPCSTSCGAGAPG